MKPAIFLIALLFVVVTGCSDRTDKVEDEHVWKEQTDTIDKAKQAEQMIMDSASQQRRDIDEQSQ